MSEKIIVLHPENQPEVDIYPIIKEGSIPNSVIDNQKIKSRTIINSNIALNTLKYEVLHQTLKDLIDSKITQNNMENYLTSYYYNVEETQQYVGSEINTLHQTIQNEFYSNATIDNMLMEKTDLSLFRQYLPSTYLDLTKQQDNQTSKLNIHANGSIFLMNSGNKTNSGNYYLPNSIVKTEDAPNGYYVLSTTNDDYQSLYNLGAYDKITTNSDGTYTITRQTGYVTIEDSNILSTFTSGGSKVFTAETNIILPNAVTDWNQEFGTSNIGYQVRSLDGSWVIDKTIGGIGGQSVKIANNDFTTIDQFKALCPINIQYKMTTSYTEKVEKNHYAVYNQRFILDHNKSEAERSANLWDEQWEVGSINSATGDNITATDRIRTKNYIKVSTYTLYITIENFSNVFCYDNNKSFLGVATYTKKGVGFVLNLKNNTSYIRFNTNTTYGATYKNDIAIFEGSEPLPYQPYEGKTIHEKDLENSLETKQDKLVSGTNIKKINGNDILGSGNITIGTIPIYNVSQLYKHDYELEAKPSDDTIYVTCWSTKPDKILLIDITRYAFSNVQVYNSGNDETIQVIKWSSQGFKYINDSGNIDGMGYIVLHYYINGEPTTY